VSDEDQPDERDSAPASAEDDPGPSYAEDDPGPPYVEPDPEPDPEAHLPDPESELPSVPSVAIPTPSTTESDASPALVKGFWSTVLVWNVALLATSVGAMMVAFDVERRLGLALMAVGLFSALRGYRKYRALDEQHKGGELTGPAEETPPDAPTTNDERNG
jgi:hypothetical protein